MMRLGILGSTRGTNMMSIINAIHQGTLSAKIEVVLSNKADAMILDKAREHGVLAEHISPQGLSREEYDAKISKVLVRCKVDLVVLIGYMKILSGNFVHSWQNRIINVHPSLLPAFSGKMDLEVHQAVLDAGVDETGCTIHFVTEELDAGPILLQRKCSVLPGDTAESLKARVQALEGPGLVDAILKLGLEI